MRYRLQGNWTKGLAFDLHTVASVYLGPDEFGHERFDNTRSTIGELVYRLKNKQDPSVIPQIISLLEAITGIEKCDVIIPVPSSKKRVFQPVDEIARALGQQRSVRVLKGYFTKESRAELKGIDDPDRRRQILEKAIQVSGTEDVTGQRVLLLDDIYRSGATLNACCRLLQQNTQVGDIYVLTLTKTRTHR